MSNYISDLFTRLEEDSWRKEVGFSQHIQLAQQSLFANTVSDEDCVKVLNEWLQRFQPCLFGRIAAKLGKISYCILQESDLRSPEEAIKKKIQSARTKWTREGFEGGKSGFVISVISPTIANALPNENMKALAQRLCSLYLLCDIATDEIYLDNIWLEKPGRNRTTWEWSVGVNYFCAQGDKRWWQDHRIPGGMAFSMNSVGHMVKSGMLADVMSHLEELMDAPEEYWVTSKISSLEAALEFAMRTIYGASNAVSGKATWLLPLPANKKELPVEKCPAKLPHFLEDKNFCTYEGYYHTDFTLPSEYFLSDAVRPDGVKVHNLDLTYLFDKSLDNPDFEKIGVGRRVRAVVSSSHKASKRSLRKRDRAEGRLVNIDKNERLVKALKNKLEE
jgi:hypothetical protein